MVGNHSRVSWRPDPVLGAERSTGPLTFHVTFRLADSTGGTERRQGARLAYVTLES